MRRLTVSERTLLCDTLCNEIAHSGRARYLHRLHCMLLIAQGFSCYQVSNWFKDNPRSLERWIRRFEQSGIQGLREKPKKGRCKILTEVQLDTLQQELGDSPQSQDYEQQTWNSQLLQIHLARHYDVQLGLRQCQRLLKDISPDDVNHE